MTLSKICTFFFPLYCTTLLLNKYTERSVIKPMAIMTSQTTEEGGRCQQARKLTLKETGKYFFSSIADNAVINFYHHTVSVPLSGKIKAQPVTTYSGVCASCVCVCVCPRLCASWHQPLCVCEIKPYNPPAPCRPVTAERRWALFQQQNSLTVYIQGSYLSQEIRQESKLCLLFTFK